MYVSLAGSSVSTRLRRFRSSVWQWRRCAVMRGRARAAALCALLRACAGLRWPRTSQLARNQQVGGSVEGESIQVLGKRQYCLSVNECEIISASPRRVHKLNLLTPDCQIFSPAVELDEDFTESKTPHPRLAAAVN